MWCHGGATKALILGDFGGGLAGVGEGVGVHEEDFLGGAAADGVEVVLDGAVEPAGAEGLDDVAGEGPAAAVAFVELVRKGGGADVAAVEVYHGAAGDAVHADGAGAVVGCPGGGGVGSELGAALGGGLAGAQAQGEEAEEGLHDSHGRLMRRVGSQGSLITCPGVSGGSWSGLCLTHQRMSRV